MKFLLLRLIASILCVTKTIANVNCPNDNGHTQGPCEVDVESPEIQITPSPTESPTVSPSSTPSAIPTLTPTQMPTSMPTLKPTGTPTTTPSATPTSPPTSSPTRPPTTMPSASPSSTPTSQPTSIPTVTPSSAPSAEPTSTPSILPTVYKCATQDGIFGNIDSEAVRTIEYGYEVEANTTADIIESEIIGRVESAVTDSILAEIFAECAVRRNLRVTRRLEITGVTQNPEDIVLDDVVCGNVGEGNECVVVDGALSIYATDEESATALEEEILAAIKANMDSGNFNDVDPSVVRVTYTELQSDTPSGSESNGNDAIGEYKNTPVLVGSLVGAGVIMAAILTIAYMRRANNAQEDGTATDLGDQPSGGL